MISKTAFSRAISLLPGWHTHRKIVVIESDDWGSIRTKDKESLNILAEKFPHFLKDEYTKYDSIESTVDLNALFEVLNDVKDIKGNPAIITANTIVANPDFEKIKDSGFTSYFYKAIDDKEFYKKNELVVIKKGIQQNLYKPQLHGREHLNIALWLKALKEGKEELLAAFDCEMFGVPMLQYDKKRKNVMAALDFETSDELDFQKNIMTDAQHIFNRIFGFNSTTFIAPSYIWHPGIELHLKSIGIKALQGLPYQYIPNPKGDWYKTKFRYTGGRTKNGMINLVRNAFFEPAISKNNDTVLECISRIELAFKMKKPAIIGSHRLNFIGGLDENNRAQNLNQLHQLLQQVKKKWPNVEFMSSDKLLELINKK